MMISIGVSRTNLVITCSELGTVGTVTIRMKRRRSSSKSLNYTLLWTNVEQNADYGIIVRTRCVAVKWHIMGNDQRHCDELQNYEYIFEYKLFVVFESTKLNQKFDGQTMEFLKCWIIRGV